MSYIDLIIILLVSYGTATNYSFAPGGHTTFGEQHCGYGIPCLGNSTKQGFFTFIDATPHVTTSSRSSLAFPDLLHTYSAHFVRSLNVVPAAIVYPLYLQTCGSPGGT
uniref:Putative secreted protein n=1 Tax=Panstrongylus lignarius TaxID=156445 RepID=A0A224Y2G9_9HEMI